MYTLNASEVGNKDLYHYLTNAVGPRPIAFVSTINSKGERNLSPFSFFNVFGSNPPTMVFSPVLSGRTGAPKDTLNNVKEVPEVVIHVVTADILHQMSLTSSPYESSIDEFDKAGLTAVPSELVRPFRVKESPIQMECNVVDIIELGKEGGAGNLVVCELLKMHIEEGFLRDDKSIAVEKLGLISRMGGNWYSAANPSSMFEVVKPMYKGIGFDRLPSAIRNSSILTGNELAQLSSVEEIPCEVDIEKTNEEALHIKVQNVLKTDSVQDAWQIFSITP